jgi:hypothetical protein
MWPRATPNGPAAVAPGWPRGRAGKNRKWPDRDKIPATTLVG